jgi:hypothetical protein
MNAIAAGNALYIKLGESNGAATPRFLPGKTAYASV